MSEPLLTLAIPTRNRVAYLRDLLTAVEEQVRQLGIGPDTLQVYVSDNASTDATPAMVQAFATRLPHLTYSPNPENIGAERNVIRCARAVKGEFGWISGDDELLNPGGLARVLEAIRQPGLGLMVNLDTNYPVRMVRPARFANVREYVAACARVQPHILIEHTLLTSNVYRTCCLDIDAAERAIETNYPHMYGFVTGLKIHGGAVLVSADPIITLRSRRAPAVDGQWPPDLERSWLHYLNWMREELDVPELRAEDALREVKAALFQKLRHHPFRFVWDNLPALAQPQAYRFFLRRLWNHWRGGPPR